jgi:hypothetical protein
MMTRRDRIILRSVLVAVLAAVGLALLFGLPETCQTSGFASVTTCRPASTSHWWNSGAQISEADIHGAVFGYPGTGVPGFVSAGDPLGNVFGHLLEWTADRGRQLWNPAARSSITRWLFILIAGGVLTDVIKSIVRAIFTDPERKRAGSVVS